MMFGPIWMKIWMLFSLDIEMLDDWMSRWECANLPTVLFKLDYILSIRRCVYYANMLSA